MNASDKTSKTSVQQWVTFDIGDERYGIEVLHVQEVLKRPEIAPVPGAPYHILGIINLRGNVVTVLCTRRRFGLNDSVETEDQRIVIVEFEGQHVGFLVDAVREVVNIPVKQIDSTPNIHNDDQGRYISGVFAQANPLLLLIDTGKLIGAKKPALQASEEVF